MLASPQIDRREGKGEKKAVLTAAPPPTTTPSIVCKRKEKEKCAANFLASFVFSVFLSFFNLVEKVGKEESSSFLSASL